MDDTPLHCAARAGNTNMVARLVELASEDEDDKVGAFLRAQDKRGETALHEAVRFGGEKMVQALMNKDKELARVAAKDGTSPLYLAISLSHHKIAQLLHNADDKLSYSGPKGQNALHAAAVHDREMTTLLLGWNKDLVKQKDGDGSTPLHFAASAPDPSLHFTIFVFSASNFESYSFGFYLLPPRCLTKIFEWRKLPLAQLLQADPASAFQPDKHGSFPVHVAASAGSLESVIILLTRCPLCAGLRNAKGQTFLHVSVKNKRLHIVKFVCQLWARRHLESVVNIQDNNGDTALHLAIRERELDISRCLIGNPYVLVNLQNREGKTPMDLATGNVQSGFYFGLTAHRRILSMLTFAGALTGNRRRDLIPEYNPHLDEDGESKKITDFAQIVGIGSVLVATATFAAALTMPGGVWTPGDSSSRKKAVTALLPPPPAGTPVLAGSYAFDGFVVSNTLAFICSTLATFSLVYCGVAAVDLYKRIELVTFSLALLLCAARSFCATFAFSLFLLLAKVRYGTAIASCVMTSFALLDGLWFLLASYHDTTALFFRRRKATLFKLGTGLLANIIYLFWPYIVIFGYMLADYFKNIEHITKNQPLLN
uniref:PGG domain-containing protein n=1 Tax=Arundo donax TaxID=35708 RepID=A0A0A9HIY2_ARUDO